VSFIFLATISLVPNIFSIILSLLMFSLLHLFKVFLNIVSAFSLAILNFVFAILVFTSLFNVLKSFNPEETDKPTFNVISLFSNGSKKLSIVLFTLLLYSSILSFNLSVSSAKNSFFISFTNSFCGSFLSLSPIISVFSSSSSSFSFSLLLLSNCNDLS
jgi:hypothetical protein